MKISLHKFRIESAKEMNFDDCNILCLVLGIQKETYSQFEAVLFWIWIA